MFELAFHRVGLIIHVHVVAHTHTHNILTAANVHCTLIDTHKRILSHTKVDQYTQPNTHTLILH